MSAENKKQYSGDVNPKKTWRALDENEDAVLVDVRTLAEWKCVGVPDLSSISKDNILIEWVGFPDGVPNQSFMAELEKSVPSKTTPIYFLCRTGVRSVSAAIKATSAGYENAYNVLEGFEGSPDAAGHRGRVSGWQGRNLPWKH